MLYLRSKYHLGSIRIVWYLARFHGIKISDAGVTRILSRDGVLRNDMASFLRAAFAEVSPGTTLVWGGHCQSNLGWR